MTGGTDRDVREEAAAPGVRLFTAEAILAHTLALTPLVGSTLAALNHRRLGARAACGRTLLLFAVPSGAPLADDERAL